MLLAKKKLTTPLRKSSTSQRKFMNKDPNKVVQLPSRTPHGALERLNRITGAQFSRWPDWLLPESQSKANSEPVVDSPELQVG